ncbi:uncharacterized protein LOC141602129 [Silene latifolia]|uniref:uncharacterized protein LOC141602129 n=1 Tax=Silene latifolia TaxID=37657 RepID=UPI003D77CC30
MECNKDDAAKAKEIAEKKLMEKDLNGAKKFALKAQSLYPGLNGLEQLLMTVNVYMSAEKKVNGVADWYAVLGVDISCDDETLKKQYRKLALILHPDKTKSVGAEGAFKLVSEAWSLLSDKTKRAAYDLKRKTYNQSRTSVSGIYEKVNPTHPSTNIFHASKNSPNPHLARPKVSNTFWTVCTNCRMQFEYVLQYLNKRLQCYSCKKPFLAISTAPPQTRAPSAGYMPHDTSGLPSRKTGVSTSANRPAVYSGDIGSVPAYSSATNGGEANGSCSIAKAEKPRKRRRKNGLKIDESGIVNWDQLSNVSQSSGVGTEKVTNVESKCLPSIREMSLLETRNIIMDKARKDICKKLNEWKNLTVKPDISNKVASLKKKEKSKVNGTSTVRGKLIANAEAKNPDEELSNISAMNSTDSETLASDVDMIVPDSDFHDFDKGRTENSFGDNQVWAAYDNDDGMPRYYAMIHNVLARRPFKMRISWLNSKSTSEFGNLNWTGYGFYKTNGDFRVGKYELNKNVNSFSHRVKWTKGSRGVIRIYPTKGDVWALYKNWSADWNEHTPDETMHQYEMVEVLDDYNEEKGAIVIPLVKVAGFKTVFHKHVDQKEVRIIPREEMFRFSHQVPSYLLTGQESSKAPKGCVELDPAAIPTELLQVTTETSEHVPKVKIEGVERDDPSEVNNTPVKKEQVNFEEVEREDPSEIKKTQLKESVKFEIASEVRMMDDGISTVG